jgi:sec-independent protein translocase protein TatA
MKTYINNMFLQLIVLMVVTCINEGFVSAFAPIHIVQQRSITTSYSIHDGACATPTNTVFQNLAHFEQRSIHTSSNNRLRVRMQGLFGLGGPELVVILIAAAFLLGPEKLAELGKDAGKIAGELKEVPKEFQAGLAEGEAQARAMKSSSSSSLPSAPPSTSTISTEVVDVTTKTEETTK